MEFFRIELHLVSQHVRNQQNPSLFQALPVAPHHSMGQLLLELQMALIWICFLGHPPLISGDDDCEDDLMDEDMPMIDYESQQSLQAVDSVDASTTQGQSQAHSQRRLFDAGQECSSSGSKICVMWQRRNMVELGRTCARQALNSAVNLYTPKAETPTPTP